MGRKIILGQINKEAGNMDQRHAMGWVGLLSVAWKTEE